MSDESLYSDYADENYGYRRPAFSQANITPRTRVVVDSGGTWIHTPMDENFVEALKGFFKWGSRHWVPEKTAWRIDGLENVDNAIALTQTFYNDVVVIDERD